MCTILVTIAIMMGTTLNPKGELKVKQFSFHDIKKARQFAGYYTNQMEKTPTTLPYIQGVNLDTGMQEFECSKFYKGD